MIETTEKDLENRVEYDMDEQGTLLRNDVAHC